MFSSIIRFLVREWCDTCETWTKVKTYGKNKNPKTGITTYWRICAVCGTKKVIVKDE
jgi:hypothetical protein